MMKPAAPEQMSGISPLTTEEGGRHFGRNLDISKECDISWTRTLFVTSPIT